MADIRIGHPDRGSVIVDAIPDPTASGDLVLPLLHLDPEPEPTDLADQFEHVLELLTKLDWDTIWETATDTERRTLLDEFVPAVEVHDDHLEIEVRGAPKLNVALHEVGLQNRSVENTGVGGPTRTPTLGVISLRARGMETESNRPISGDMQWLGRTDP